MDSFIQKMQCENCKIKCPIKDRVTFPICVPSTLEQAKQLKKILDSYYMCFGFTDEISSFFDTLCNEIDNTEEALNG